MENSPKNTRDELTHSHDRISPTAWGVAYTRTLSDIPYAAEVFHELQQIMTHTRSADQIRELMEIARPEITPMFEARFKLVNRLLQEHQSRQILEIAAGFSPRSLTMAQNPAIEYVEFDLPALMSEKRAIIGELIKNGTIPPLPNVHWSSGNALAMEDLSVAVQPFRQEPIAVLNEGLLRYLTFAEKDVLAQNVRQLLERFGGLWITPDTSVRPEHSFGPPDKNMREQNDRIERLTGIEIAQNYFEDENAAREFFEKSGFVVERHSFMEVADELVSPRKLKLTNEQVAKRIGRLAVFVMTLPSKSS